MSGSVSLGALFDLSALRVDGEVDVGHAVTADGGAASQMGDVFDVFRPHDSRIVNRDIHEYAVKIDVLLRVRLDQIVEVMAGDRQDRLPVELGVVQSIKQMDAPRTGGRQADAQFAGEFRITAGHEGRRFLVPDLHEANFVLSDAQRFHNPVYAVAWQTEDDFDSPFDQDVDQ